jgi:hypothetical protein
MFRQRGRATFAAAQRFEVQIEKRDTHGVDYRELSMFILSCRESLGNLFGRRLSGRL